MFETIPESSGRALMTAPCNAFPITPSKESDQLPAEDKALSWNNLQTRK